MFDAPSSSLDTRHLENLWAIKLDNSTRYTILIFSALALLPHTLKWNAVYFRVMPQNAHLRLTELFLSCILCVSAWSLSYDILYIEIPVFLVTIATLGSFSFYDYVFWNYIPIVIEF